MKGTQLEQTKRAIKMMKDLGFERRDFSAQTPCNHRGEYQPTEIHLKAKTKEDDIRVNRLFAEKAEEIAGHGFKVYLLKTSKGDYLLGFAEASSKGEVQEVTPTYISFRNPDGKETYRRYLNG